jgi:malate dehydrogenase (oxaloacetate-decarboxylating)(NADP+)
MSDSSHSSKEAQTSFEKEALAFHKKGRPGKIEVVSTKPTHTERGLSLAYSPGVAVPCKEIHKNPQSVFEYTAKGNLVAVVSNGTAVLGLGNIGPLASKPVMEGKGILFKQFAGIDVFDIEIKAMDIEATVRTIEALEPTFGGINLEDIKAPECFEIEAQLKQKLKIPVFHDDQHGTAIVSGAALINACQITGKKMDEIRLVVNGAGASAVACSHFFISLGVKKEHLIMCDTQGVIYQGRDGGMNPYKAHFANKTEARTLTEALEGADVFVGLSAAGALTEEMLLKMNDRPIIFAMANPDPEIEPGKAKAIRPDCIVATGRSDYPNQVNNVLGFPAIFRGALDVQATQINEAMKLAACHALAQLAREEVPEKVSNLYGRQFCFGPEYLIPKPFDPRVLLRVAPAVAEAAASSGVAQRPIQDKSAYFDRLESLQGAGTSFIRSAIHRIHMNHQGYQNISGGLTPIVFPEGTSQKILRSLTTIIEEKICQPILLGSSSVIHHIMDEMGLDSLKQIPIIDPLKSPFYDEYVEHLYQMRARKGVQKAEAYRLMKDPNYFACMMVKQGHAQGLITGSTQNYADAVKPILQIIGVARDKVAAGLNMALVDEKLLLLADTTTNRDPSADILAKIGSQCADVLQYFGHEARVAMLSYSNFTGQGGTPEKMKKAAELLQSLRLDVVVDGDIQGDSAVNEELLSRLFPFSRLKQGANVLIFPNLESSNICYKLMQQLGRGEILGPFLMGVRRACNVLQRTTTVDNIINSVVFTVLSAQVIQSERQKKESSTFPKDPQDLKDSGDLKESGELHSFVGPQDSVKLQHSPGLHSSVDSQGSLPLEKDSQVLQNFVSLEKPPFDQN